MKMRKLLCALLVAVLTLPGGLAAAEPSVAMGRYMEQKLTAPGEGMTSFAQLGGTTYAVDESGKTLYVSEDMVNWEQSESGHDEAVASIEYGVNVLMVTEDGTLYLSGPSMYTGKNYIPYIERIANGKAERVQLDRRLDTEYTNKSICVLPSGELLGVDEQAVYKFSPEGVTILYYPVLSGLSIAVHEGEMSVFSRTDTAIHTLDIISGERLRTLPLPNGTEYGVLAYDREGALFFANSNGLYRANAGGSLLEQIVDGKLCTLGKPSASAMELMFDAQNNPVIAFSEDMGASMSLIAYVYDQGVPTEPSTVLSVFTLYESYSLRQCASEFQMANSDVLVDITVALPEDTAVTRDDAIRTLNTELLAGQGPDVIVLDGLPVQSYIDKDVLQDLAPVVRPLIDSGELHPNLAGAFEKDGAIPAVPTRFLLPSIWGKLDGIETLDELAASAKANPDMIPTYAVDVDTLIGTFYLSCQPAWFQADGRLDERAIEAFLTAMQGIRGKWTYEAYVEATGWDYLSRFSERGQELLEWNPYVWPSGGWSNLEELYGGYLFLEGKQSQLPFLLRGADAATIPYGQSIVIGDVNFSALPGQAEGCYVPVQMMGASKGGAHAEAALKFIACALDQKTQGTDLFEGFPVNAKMLDALQAKTDTIYGFDDGTFYTTWPDQTIRDQLHGVIDGLKTPVLCDFTLFQMIVAESTPFFEGKIDAKQAAQNVFAKANVYVTE